MGISKLIEKGKNVVSFVKEKLSWIVEKLGEFIGIYPIDSQVEFTSEEENLISKSTEIIKNRMPNGVSATMQELNYYDRQAEVETIGNELLELYGLDNTEIILTDSPDVFPQEENTLVRGLTDWDNNCIYINSALLKSNDGEVLKQVIVTLTHEIRHMMQKNVVSGMNKYGRTHRSRRIWGHNWSHYIGCGNDFESYYKQPIEVDARNFANRVVGAC